MAWYDNPLVRIGAGVMTGGASELARSYLNAGQGSNTAAQGAGNVAARGDAFSQQQWDRQMQGLDSAQGAYKPAANEWDSLYGANGPGYGEQWYQNSAGGFAAPQRDSGTFNNFNSWAGNPNNNASQQGQYGAQNYMGSADAQNNAYQNMGYGLQSYSGPQNGNQQWAQSQPQFNQGGAAENYYSQNQPRYNQETNANAAYDQIGQQLMGPSQSSTYAAQMGGTLSRLSDDASARLGTQQEFANDQTALGKNEGENKGYIRGANQANDYLNSQMGALQGPGQYENFVSSEINGDNPAYDREKAQGIAQINQEMARRGNFNSGAALTSIGNYTGALDAADYQNRANRAQQAQQMQLARIGQGTQAAQGAAGLDIQRGGALGSLDTQNEAAQLGRQNFGLNAQKTNNDFQMGIQGLGLQAAGQADSSNLARLMGAGQLGSQADNSNLNLLNAGQNAANSSQSQMLARLMGGMNSSNQLDQTQLNSDQQGLARMLGSFNMAQGSDASNMAKAQQTFGMGQGLDASNLARYQALGNQANSADQFDLSRLLGQGNQAESAQSAEDQRKQQAFASLFGLDNAQAGQYGQFYNTGGQLSGKAQSDALNALMAQYGLQGQAQNQQNQAPWDALNVAINGYKALNGVPGKTG